MRILPLGERRLFCRYFSDYIQIAITDTITDASRVRERARSTPANDIDNFGFFLSRDAIKKISELLQHLHASLSLVCTTRPAKLNDLIF